MPTLYDDDEQQELDSPIGIVGVSQGGTGASLAATGPGYLYQASSGSAVSIVGSVSEVGALATSGAGTSGSPWAGWETAVNALPANSAIHFGAGFYTLASRINCKSGWQITGTGVASKISSALAGTSFHVAAASTPLATTTQNVTIRDLWIHNSNASATGSAILGVSARMLSIADCKITGHRYGISLVYSQVVNIDRVQFAEFTNDSPQLRGSIWIVSGGDYNTTYADIDYSAALPHGTNVVTVRGCQIGNTDVAGRIGVIDDGGYNHNFHDNNFNGTYNAFYLSGVTMGQINGTDFELVGSSIISVHAGTYNSNTANAGGTSLMGRVTCTANLFVPSGTNAVIKTEAPNTSGILDFVLIGNSATSTTALIQGVASAGTANTSIIDIGTVVSGAEIVDALPFRYIEIGGGQAGTQKQLRIGGNGLTVEQLGTNTSRAGAATLVGGTVTTSNTTVTAATDIILSRRTVSGTPGHLTYTRSAGVSFTINSTQATDAGVVYWELREP